MSEDWHGGDEEGSRDDSKRGPRELGGGWEDSRPQQQSEASAGSGQSAESLSIEETNKIRAKLGLKPLQVEVSEFFVRLVISS